MTTLSKDIDGLVSGGGMKIPMMTIIGGESTREVASSRDPGARFARKVPGPSDLSNVVCGTDYDQASLGPLRAKLRQASTDETVFAVTKYFRDAARNINGSDTYTGILIKVGGMDGDTNGGTNKSTLSLEFAVSNVTAS